MHEILRQVRRGDFVLDLGSQSGSFAAKDCAGRTVRVDLEPARAGDASVVQADAAFLPFRDSAFAAAISNHSLEHFVDLDAALREAARVLRPDGALFVAVPDATTLTDRLYRWLARGGGHVNAFQSASEVIQWVSRRTGLRYAGGRVLCTSFSFLHPRNRKRPSPRRLWLLGGGSEWTLRWLNGALRLWDHWGGGRASVYGWALYFGEIRGAVSSRTWVNVCVGCGSGHDAESLLEKGSVRRSFGFALYECPACGTRNFFSPDRDSTEVPQPGLAATLEARGGVGRES
jgi:hypothetical protein